MQAATLAQDTRSAEYLTFSLGQEEYAVNILKVQEIRSYDAVTSIANMPDFIKGVINLRGVIVPVIDMRIKFKLCNPTYNEFTIVIILNIADRVVGMVVDAVSDVLLLTADDISAVPSMGTAINTRHLRGFATHDERMISIVDIEQLMSSDDMGLIDHHLQ